MSKPQNPASKTTTAPAVVPIPKLPFDKPARAFTVVRVPGGWRFVQFTVDAAGTVSEVDDGHVCLKAEATGYFKVAAQKYWSALG